MGRAAIDFNNIFFGSHERKYKIIKLAVIYLIAFVVIYYGYKHVESTQPAINQITLPSTLDRETVSKQERLAIESGKQQSLALNEFDENYCRQAIFPDNLKTKEYTANYNLEGREGFRSTWSATEKPPGEFSVLKMPSYFIVYRNGLLEGCGHKITVADTGKISFSADFNDENVLCKNKDTIVAKDDAKMPAKIEIFVKTAENTVLYYTIYVNPIFDINKFLNSLGCK